MNWFRHFMAGGMPREEAASALLAASLESVESFREYFFELINADNPSELAQTQWKYTVEEAQVDLTLRSVDTIVLIENKIKTASMSDRTQLVRYYKQYRAQYPDHQIHVVFLTPSGRGDSFIASLRSDEEFQQHSQDRVVKITWDQLAQYQFHQDDRAIPFASSAIKSIAQAAQRYIEIKSVRQSTGIACAEIVEAAFKQIVNNTTIPLQFWGPDENAVPNHIYYQIFSTKYPITAWSGIAVHRDDASKDVAEISQPMQYLIKIKLNESRINNRIKKGLLGVSDRIRFKNWWIYFKSEIMPNHVSTAYQLDASKKWLVHISPVVFDTTNPIAVLRDRTLEILKLAEHSLQENDLDIVS